MSVIYEKTTGLTDAVLSYCPGCTHGIIHKLVAESIVELGLEGRTVGVAPVGCSVLAYNFFSFDMVQAPHGRAPAVATGIRRAIHDSVVFTYQGDGDLAAIGTAETVHAATRGENIVIIFVPTTLPGQITQTSPYGRDIGTAGFPVRVCEMLATLDGVTYAERVSVHDISNIRKTKKAIKNAFNNQSAGKGFSIVEVLSTCPTNWGMTPVESLDWLKSNLIPYYPLGIYKDTSEKEASAL